MSRSIVFILLAVPVLIGLIVVRREPAPDSASLIATSSNKLVNNDSGHPLPALSDEDQLAAPAGSVTRALKRSDSIPNVTMFDQDGKAFQFRDDLIRDKKVVVNFMYTVCTGICPGMTENIRKAREELAGKGVDNLVFISITLEPETDTPEQLRNYMQDSGIVNKPGLAPWIFLTGDHEDIEKIRFALGVYDPDPEVDADRRQHGGILTYGNDRSDWWGATPALQNSSVIVTTLMRNVLDDKRSRPRFSLR